MVSLGPEERISQLEQRLRRLRIGRLLLLRLLQETVAEREELRVQLRRQNMRRVGR